MGHAGWAVGFSILFHKPFNSKNRSQDEAFFSADWGSNTRLVWGWLIKQRICGELRVVSCCPEGKQVWGVGRRMVGGYSILIQEIKSPRSSKELNSVSKPRSLSV